MLFLLCDLCVLLRLVQFGCGFAALGHPWFNSLCCGWARWSHFLIFPFPKRQVLPANDKTAAGRRCHLFPISQEAGVSG
jgi:hypothetical protein